MTHEPLVLAVGERWESAPLVEAAAAGYLWEAQSPGAWLTVTVLREPVIPVSEAEGIVGAAGAVRLVFEAVATGSGNVTAVCKRPWVDLDNSATTYQRHVVVR